MNNDLIAAAIAKHGASKVNAAALAAMGNNAKSLPLVGLPNGKLPWSWQVMRQSFAAMTPAERQDDEIEARGALS